MRSLILSACCTSAFLIVSTVAADTVTFQMIPNAVGANDLTPDGRYIVGQSPDVIHSYRLDTFTNEFLQFPQQVDAFAVSDDGSVVLGNIPDPELGDQVAAIWTVKTGVFTSIGYLPTAGSCPSRSAGYELSADGSVAVGLSWVNGCQARAFRWTESTGMVEMGVLANGGNRASVCSADGNVIGGFAQGSFSRTPALWDGLGTGTLLDPPNGDALGEVHGISDDGNTLLGEWEGQAVKWTAPNWDRTVIGDGFILPGWRGIPLDVADNGTVVGFDILFGNRRAWIQPYGVGPLIDLKSYVEANGGIVPENLTLEVCQAISADGRKIIGHGFMSGAWVITITPGCAADVAPTGGDGSVNVDDLLAVINTWGPGAGSAGDITGDNVVDVDDLLAVITGWGECPGAQGACCTGETCVQLTESECSTAGGTYSGNYVPCTPATCVNNDLCADAIDITASMNGEVVLGDNSLATPGFGGGDLELPSGSPSCHWDQFPEVAHGTVWYTFTAPASGSVTIELCSSQVPFRDSTLAVYSGTCGKLTEVACDEDSCGVLEPGSFYSILNTSSLTPGEQYYLCVMNSGGWLGSVQGPFSLTITAP